MFTIRIITHWYIDVVCHPKSSEDMFTLLSSAINNTIEVLAPTTPADQQFAWHWDQIMHFYQSEDKRLLSGPIEATTITLHLEKMCQILCEEQQDQESDGQIDDTIGPSVEYLLQHKILESMASLAQRDAPLGLCQRILRFFTSLLKNSSLELLPHKCVYSAVHKLIMICGKLIAGPYESSEVQFLSCVCDQIHRNPDLISCFLSDSFPLISALLSLLQSPDQEISTNSGDALIKLLSAVNERSEHIITFETPFCSKILDQMVVLYHSIPRSLRADQIESAISTCFSGDNTENCKDFESFSPAVRKFMCFLRWFVFFDMIINHLPNDESILTKSLLDHLKSDFLESCICPDLLGIGYREQSDADDHIFMTTVLLSNCLRNIVSERLASTIGEFLLVDTRSDSLIDNQKYSETKNKLKHILLDRCLLIEPNANASESSLTLEDSFIISKRIQLCMSSMQLFEDILRKPSVNVLNELVINYLKNRTYFDESVAISETNLDSNEFQDMRPFLSPHSSVDSEEGSVGSHNFNYVSTSHVQRVLQYFTSLVPDELKSSQTSDDLEYETYVREAQKHFEEIAAICHKWKNWTTETVMIDNSQREQPSNDPTGDIMSNGPIINNYQITLNRQSSAQSPFEEGPFLAMIFDNLEHMVELPYEVNLQVIEL